MMALLVPLLIALAWTVVQIQITRWNSRKMLAEKSRPLRHPALADVTARMAGAVGVDHIPVHLLEMEAVNGLADADGKIYLTRGFIAKLEAGVVTPDELASVIAHELGHVAHGHARRRMIDVTGQNTVFILLGGVLNRFIPFVGPWLARLASGALMAKLSRRDEFEADAWATALLIKAGIGTQPQKSLFRKLEGLTGTGRAGPDWLASHPKAAERIRAIEANEARWLP